MWELRSDFQGRWETKGNLGLVFLVFHGPSFPQPPWFSCAPLMMQTSEQLAFRLLHCSRSLSIGVVPSGLSELIQRQI
jgi:hypothetical protein